MTKPLYTAHARVAGGRQHGHGKTNDGALDVRLRPPTELGGNGDGTNPEQLFAVGYAACFEAAMRRSPAGGRDRPRRTRDLPVLQRHPRERRRRHHDQRGTTGLASGNLRGETP